MLKFNKKGKNIMEVTDNGDVKIDGEVVVNKEELKEKLDKKIEETKEEE